MIHNMITSAFVFSSDSQIIVQEEEGVYYVAYNEFDWVQDQETEATGGVSTP